MWTLAVQNSDELSWVSNIQHKLVLHYCCLFSIWTTTKCTTCKDIFPGLLRSWNCQEKIQDFPGGMGTLSQQHSTMSGSINIWYKARQPSNRKGSSLVAKTHCCLALYPRIVRLQWFSHIYNIYHYLHHHLVSAAVSRLIYLNTEHRSLINTLAAYKLNRWIIWK